MQIQYNQDIDHLKQSDIRRMTLECNTHSEGINLSQGVCDLPLSPVLEENVARAVSSGYNTYTRYDGIDELRSRISQKLKEFNHVKYSHETEIVVTSGTSAAFFLALYAIKAADSEVILFEPFYGYHYNTIKALGLKPVVVAMDPAKEWAIDYDEVKKKISLKTKAILINTPANPTGKVFSEEEILNLGRLAVTHDLLIITDEIYEYITYDQYRHLSPASLVEMKPNVITIGGFSKTFSITGWRIAYICGPADFMGKIGVLNDLFYICSPSPLQKAVAEGLAGIGPDYYSSMREYYQTNRDLLVETLLAKNIKVHIPRGAYYLLADFSTYGYGDGRQAADDILKRTGIATVPGASFYEAEGGKNLIRFCFAKEYVVLQDACRRLKSM